MTTAEFSLGSVVVPAADGVLAGLGHDVLALGERALGLVAEARKGKVYVLFPELRLSLWLDKDEVADVQSRARAGDKEFAQLLPAEAFLAKLPLVWCLSRICSELSATYVLNFERGYLDELWDPGTHGPLAQHWQGNAAQEVVTLSVGVDEFFLERWGQLRASLAERLLFARFLPAGLHKIEVAFYLRPR